MPFLKRVRIVAGVGSWVHIVGEDSSVSCLDMMFRYAPSRNTAWYIVCESDGYEKQDIESCTLIHDVYL